MLYTGFFKRIIPFIASFGLGLLIASFFVPILPNLEGRREGRHARRWRERQELKMEVERLNQRVEELKRENETLRQAQWDKRDVPELPDFEAHHPPPPPPKRPKNPREKDIFQ